MYEKWRGWSANSVPGWLREAIAKSAPASSARMNGSTPSIG